ncbi:hypothetical protein [Paraburkholderia sp. 22B1P]|uniref:hypothetical protein n=1 Tax=Paraburkholderia sp. 22B1P TaxID=3080498 RepID=UPI00308C7926|nr:hypothetical protein PBP221_17000 [Paraburkholderia sp. 22B1P]
MWQFVQGSTFQVVGQFQLCGAPIDMTNWSITAQIHDATGKTLISNLSTSWIDSTTGTLQLNASSTSAWPVGKARIDVSARDPSGNQYVSMADYFRVIDTPLPV